LSVEQQESICDLLSESITDTIYRFLEMFEENSDKMKLIITRDGKGWDMINNQRKNGQ
jgi:hypothetical protein